MGKLALFGYHAFHTPYAIEMHRAAADMTGQSRPRVLLIPLASGDDSSYIHAFERIYGGVLGCEVDVLSLRDSQLPPNTQEMFDRAQLIFMGGGENFSAIAR
ncbi:MAG: Type 1 glutamine amidotransferase-like domain-containing protein, partial [Acetanaerobacterium sp.]